MSSIAALFLVVFDQKVGYKIAWSRSDPDVDIVGVEFKSLPSGLHSETKDLVYFTHAHLVGVSAFARAKSDAEHRNAQFAAVGALVERGYDALAPAWQYVEPLNHLAQVIIQDFDDHEPLEEYWQERKASKSSNEAESIQGSRRKYVNDTEYSSGGTLHAYHPARSLATTHELLGPLLFALQRQALLGKRILLLGHPPVQRNCEIVHNIALLSQLSTDLLADMPIVQTPPQPLYSVGISDMMALSKTSSWSACTTDAILRDKTDMYDILVVLPSQDDPGAHPVIKDASGNTIKATQRDFQRFQALHHHLWLLDSQDQSSDGYKDHPSTSDDQTALLNESKNAESSGYTRPNVASEMIEPYSWVSLAQRSLSWWASADEQGALEAEESDIDGDLLRDLPGIATTSTKPETYDRTATHAAVLQAYFERSMKLVIDKVFEVVSEANPSENELIEVSLTTLRQAGLDSWSQSDISFFEHFVKKLTGKSARVVQEPITLCGVRVC